MHFCYYDGKKEVWAKELAMKLIGELEGYGVGSIYKNRANTINETADYVLANYIRNHRYVVIVVSQNLLTDIYALVELDIIKRLFESHEVIVFSVYDNTHIPVLPERLEWINDSIKIALSSKYSIKDIVDAIIGDVIRDMITA